MSLVNEALRFIAVKCLERAKGRYVIYRRRHAGFRNLIAQSDSVEIGRFNPSHRFDAE